MSPFRRQLAKFKHNVVCVIVTQVYSCRGRAPSCAAPTALFSNLVKRRRFYYVHMIYSEFGCPGVKRVKHKLKTPPRAAPMTSQGRAIRVGMKSTEVYITSRQR